MTAKKLLSILLAFVLTVAPLTAFATDSYALVGSEDNPANLSEGRYSRTFEADNEGYWVVFTAEERGTVTFTFHSELWGFDAEVYDVGMFYQDFGSYSDPYGNVHSYDLQKGGRVKLKISTDSEIEWCDQVLAGTVEWTVSFAPNPLKEGYAVSDLPIAVGENYYALDSEKMYTVYIFEPTETGEYTFYCSAEIGIVSTNGMWVTVEPSEETVTEGPKTWRCDSVGQSIMIAVPGGRAGIWIEVEREEIVIVEIPVTVYENKANLTPFVYHGNVDDFDCVNIDDAFIDTAVLGKDGYYHLNSAQGPILYVCLTDSTLSLAGAMSYGQLRETITENGVIVEKIDYNAAVEEYLEYADDDGFYPLTEDLITILKGAGKQLGWYSEDGWLGTDTEDAWMYLCFYNEADVPVAIPGDVDGDGTVSEADVNLLMSVLVGNTETDELFDFDSDGELTIYDCVWLMQQIG